MSEAKNISDRLVICGRVIRAVSEFTGIGAGVLESRTRQQPIAQWRQVAMYLMWRLGCVYEIIGLRFSRHHATAIYAVKTIRERMSVEPSFCEQIHQLEKQLGL